MLTAWLTRTVHMVSLLVYSPQMAHLCRYVCDGALSVLPDVRVDARIAEDVPGHGEQRLVDTPLATQRAQSHIQRQV